MSHEPPPLPGRANRLGLCGAAAILFLLLIGYSAIQAPVPAVNEPHYLGKAKHLWDPAWAERDFFLESSNPHLAFYVAVGWLTRFLTQEATAWIARIAGYGILAIGWTLLARRVAGSHWAALFSAPLFLLLASLGNLSGEWLVGGVEGKTFAYGLLFAAIAFWLDGRRTASAACLGGAVSFHPIVGGWGLLCGLIAELLARRSFWFRDGRWSELVQPALVFTLTALPGLIPAAMTLGGGTPTEVARASYIQVFVRLRHHLDPTQFATGSYLAYAVMLVVWLVLWLGARKWCESREEAEREFGHGVSDHSGWFGFFVLASVAIALAGVLIGWHVGSAWQMPLRDVRVFLLKFYPFRLADVFVPLALSLALARIGWAVFSRGLVSQFVIGAALVAAYVASIAIPSQDRNPSRLSPERLAAWIEVAKWISEETPSDALIVSPARHWGFRWYSGRALYVNYKDIPQETAGLLEWERRLAVNRDWWESSPTGFYSQEDLRRLGELTGADFLVTPADATRFSVEPLFDNGTYRVYRLR